MVYSISLSIAVGASEECELDTCGCHETLSPSFVSKDKTKEDLKDSSKSCTPLGICDESSGFIVCHCGPLYTGPRCGSCISGYSGWPTCRPTSNCGTCLNGGVCDESKGQCICRPTYFGGKCEICPLDDTSMDCKTFTTPQENEVFLSKFEALEFSAIVMIFVLICLGALARWRIGCCGACINDIFRLGKLFLEDPDTKDRTISS